MTPDGENALILIGLWVLLLYCLYFVAVKVIWIVERARARRRVRRVLRRHYGMTILPKKG